jgi:hypothetical protein
MSNTSAIQSYFMLAPFLLLLQFRKVKIVKKIELEPESDLPHRAALTTERNRTDRS